LRNLQDRVAVVTGAASGIGRALALELARRGCHLAITDRSVSPLGPVADGIRQLGRQVSVHGFDVSDRTAWPRFVQELTAAHGRAHLLVNNAGVALTGPFASCSIDDLDWQLKVNLWGVVYGCHFLMPVLRAQEEAHIVNVSSIFGIISVPENAAYCMSKHAVRSLSESLEVELWDSKIRVTSVHPGAVATRICEDGRFRMSGKGDEERAKAMISGGIAPAAAATIIADGIQRNRRRIIVGRDAALLDWMQWLMPTWHRNLLALYYRRQRAQATEA
jgi:short-subunit dehydrogenase